MPLNSKNKRGPLFVRHVRITTHVCHKLYHRYTAALTGAKVKRHATQEDWRQVVQHASPAVRKQAFLMALGLSARHPSMEHD